MSFWRKDTAILLGLIVVGILFPTFGVATVLWFLTYWFVMAVGWAIDALKTTIGKSDD
tara:strand:+ start:414 stop:587 length:174 start_codon:yes stop_codon:yes gene_type:complete